MSASRTFTVWTGGGAGGAIQAGDPWRHTQGEYIRQNIDLLAYLAGDGMFLGGSQAEGHVTGAATWEPVSYIEFSLNGDTLGGLTLEAVVWYFTTNASTSVQLRLRNTTDSSNAALSTASTATTPTKETLTVTLASGVKTYRLEILGDATNAVCGWGLLRFRKVAA